MKEELKTQAKPRVERELVITEPSAESDLERLVEFFSRIPLKTRNHLRYDVTEVESCRARLEQLDGKNHWRLIATMNDESTVSVPST